VSIVCDEFHRIQTSRTGISEANKGLFLLESLTCLVPFFSAEIFQKSLCRWGELVILLVDKAKLQAGEQQ
jgi:hypothetical protein